MGREGSGGEWGSGKGSKYRGILNSMNMNKKTGIIILVAALSLTLMLVLGCSRKRESALYAGGARTIAGVGYAAMPEMVSEQAAYDQATADYEMDGIKMRAPAPSPAAMAGRMSDASSWARETDGAAAEVGDAERKLVKSAYIRIRVENLDAADASVTELLQKYEAYAASTVVDENSRHYSLRVPAPRYDIFLAGMDGMGRLLHRSENTEDVTLRYYDLEGRLETKKELLRTFQSYLGRARTIEEILAVEARISELQYDIEGTGVQFRNLANRVDYATIELNLIGPAAATPSRNVTFGERVRQMFGNFGAFLSGVAVVILGIVIYGIPVLLLVILFFWLLFGRIGLLKKLWRLVRGQKVI